MRSTFRFPAILTAAAVALALSGLTVAAQGRGKGHATTPPATPAAQGHGAKPATPPAQRPPSHPTTPASEHAKPPKPTTPPPHAQSTTVRPALAARLTPLLPAGTNVTTAAAGFKNLGQFVAAVHVSHNLDIPFDALKTRMTASRPMTLGQAIQDLKPGLNADAEVRRAEVAARDDLRRK